MPTMQYNQETVSDVAVSNERAPAYLLDLPGEIRNHIYSFVLDQHITVTLSKNSHTLRYDLGLVEPPARKWPTLKRTSYGLTQVCREIRNEFLPPFRRNTTVKLTWPTLLQYSSTVFPDPAAAKGRFLIVVPNEHNDRDCLDHVAILLWLRRKAPNLLVRIESPMQPGWASFQLHFNPNWKIFAEFYSKSHPSLSPYIRFSHCDHADSNRDGLERALEVMKKMSISAGPHARIYCEVYAPFAESWMPYVHRSSVQARTKEAVEFLRSVGLDLQGISSVSITAEDPEVSEEEDPSNDVSSLDATRWTVTTQFDNYLRSAT